MSNMACCPAETVRTCSLSDETPEQARKKAAVSRLRQSIMPKSQVNRKGKNGLPEVSNEICWTCLDSKM
jgi:hypothetical protein